MAGVNEAQGDDRPDLSATEGETAVEEQDAADAGAGAGEPDEDEADGKRDAEDDAKKLAQHLKLTPEQQRAFDKAIGKKTAQRRAAEERAQALEAELDSLKAERDELKAKVGDDAVLAAAQQAGILPEYVSAEDARIVASAEGTKAEVKNLKRLVRAGEEFTGVDRDGRERTWSVGQLADLLDAAEERLERIGPKAERIKAKAADSIRADLEEGRKVRKGVKAPKDQPAAGTVNAKPTPPALPGESGGKRRDPRADAQPTVDWGKVSDPDSMKQQLLAEERGRRK